MDPKNGIFEKNLVFKKIIKILFLETNLKFILELFEFKPRQNKLFRDINEPEQVADTWRDLSHSLKLK